MTAINKVSELEVNGFSKRRYNKKLICKGSCYFSAWKIAYELDIQYIEGEILVKGEYIPHAWNSDKEGNEFDLVYEYHFPKFFMNDRKIIVQGMIDKLLKAGYASPAFKPLAEQKN